MGRRGAQLALAALVLLGWLQPAQQNELGGSFLAPSRAHWFGTDRLGRDMMNRIAEALLNTIVDVAPATAASFALALTIAVILHAGSRASGMLRRGTDLIMACLQAMPSLLAAFVVAFLFGSGRVATFLLLLSFSLAFAIPFYRTEVARASRSTSVVGAETLGGSWIHIFRYYFLPRVWGRLLRYALFDFGSLISLLSLLSLMGVVSPDQPNLGKLIFDARPYLFTHSWLFLAPFSTLILLLWAIWPTHDAPALKDSLR